MTRRPAVGALQLVATRGDKAANLTAIEDLGAKAAKQGATVIVAPEMALTGYCWPDEPGIRSLAETLDGPSVHRLSRLAKLTGAWFIVGIPELDRDLGVLHNTCVLVSPEGCQGSYRKIHPFLADPFWAVDGNGAPPVWSTPAGRVTPLICADLDYPEPTRYAALSGADWIAFPSAWVDEPGPSATWRLRAWENGMPIVAADMAGHELGVQFSGGTSVLDHTGSVIAAMDDGAGYVTALLDLDAAAVARRQILGQRRPAEYRPLAISKRWPRRAAEALFGHPPTADHVTAAVLTAPPGDLPAPPEETTLAVLPGFHLCGGSPPDHAAAEMAARRWDDALDRAAHFARENGCEVVTSLVEAGDAGRLHHTLVAVDQDSKVVTRRASHLAAHETWASPGDGSWLIVPRPWGRLALLAGQELAMFEPSRVCAIRDADVLAVPAATTWPWPVPFPGTRVPLGPELQAPDPHFAHPGRLRAGDSNVWLALANWDLGPTGTAGTPSGIFSADHVRVPRVEQVATSAGWISLACATTGPDELGMICETKPQLIRRRTDLFAKRLLEQRH